ncbi:MAG: thiamine diphosphokinase [Clostridia bacterium]|nr:thiamine diphosphokinase [Clostridia bacterium]
MKKCIIFGSVETVFFNDVINENDLVIAADGGLKSAKKFNINPDLIVGDFDSLKYIPHGENVIIHPEIKDETDLILAIDIGLEKGYKDFIIYGCLGGRLDHTYASIQTASYVTEKGGTAIFKSNDYYMTVIKNSSIHFTSDCEGYISVFSYSETATGVTEKGLFYELSDSKLTCDYPLGISNCFTGKESFVSVKNGKLCVIWNGTKGNYVLGGYDE